MKITVLIDNTEPPEVYVDGRPYASTLTTTEAGRVITFPAPLHAPDHTPKVHAHPRKAELDAAKGIAPKANTIAARVLRAFTEDYLKGGEGLTSFQIATAHALNLYTAAPRVTELAHGGWLVERGRGPSVANPVDGATRFRLSTAAIHSLGLPPPPDGDQLDLLEANQPEGEQSCE